MVNGAPLIVEHPANNTKVIDDETEIVGSVFYPYIKGSEIWAVCKVFKDKTATALNDGVFSTSPSFITTGELKTIDDESVYFEDAPLAINHIALLPTKYGVWDKFKPENRNKAIDMKLKNPHPPQIWNDDIGEYEDFDDDGGGSKDDLIISLLEKIVAKLDIPAPAATPAPAPVMPETAPAAETPKVEYDAEPAPVAPTAPELAQRVEALETAVNASRPDDENEKIANVENDSAILKGMGIGNGAKIATGENATEFKRRVTRANWEEMKALGISTDTAAAFANSLDVLNDDAALEIPYQDSVTALKGVKPKAVGGVTKRIEQLGHGLAPMIHFDVDADKVRDLI
jgi:hypothetical protein